MAKAKAHAPRNSLLPGGISRFGRSRIYKKKALYKRKKVAQKPAAVKKEQITKTKPIGGDKNGKERVIPLKKESRFYPVEDTRRPLKNRKAQRPTKLRKSLTPGTVVILLAGRHRGKRVVFLKQLPSGVLLVTGPYKVNGVPLRRVPQSYVIATQTKIDISKLTLSDKLSDEMFKRQKKQKKSSDAMFEESPEGYKPSEERKVEQKTVDDAVLAEISKVPQLRKYMQQFFTLRQGQYPHEMVF